MGYHEAIYQIGQHRKHHEESWKITLQVMPLYCVIVYLLKLNQ